MGRDRIDFLVRYLHVKGEMGKVPDHVRRDHPDLDFTDSAYSIDALNYWINIDFPHGKLFPYDLILAHSLDTNQWCTADTNPAYGAWNIVGLGKVRVGSDSPEGMLAEGIQGD